MARRTIARWVLWKGLNVPKNMPMPPFGATFERMSDNKTDPEQQRAEPEADHQEGLARERQARRAEGGQHDDERQADLHVAVGIAHAAREQVDAKILDTLRGQRRDQRGGRKAAHRRDAVAVQSPSPCHDPEHRQVERVLRDEPSPAGQP